MKYLLDTDTLIWSVLETTKLSPTVRNILQDANTQIYVSPVNFWEISLKHSIGKITFLHVRPEDFPAICSAMAFDLLPLHPEVAATSHQLTATHHKDPFDRMLIWQALCQKIPLLSKDDQINLYRSEGLEVIW